MKARLLLIFTMLLAAAGTAFALDTIFNDYIYSGQTVTAEGMTFVITENANRQEISADFGNGILFIKNNSCQQHANVRLCLSHMEFDYTLREDKLKILATSLSPKLAITRTIEAEEFEAGSATTVEVEIENTGGLATNVVYEDLFTDGI